MGEEVEESIDGLRLSFRTGRTRSVAWRKSQLGSILRLLSENEEKIFGALYEDLGKHPVECYRDELGVVLKSADYALRNLDRWVAPKNGNLPLLFFPARGQVISEPLGVVLVISSWNFPISLALDPVIGAISAGNAVVLKPSELAPACSAFLAQHIPLYLDTKAVKVVEGGVDMGERLLRHRWDKIFFTGGPKVGQTVMSAASRHLTPVTLELGGKCPTILDTLSDAYDIKIMVKRIAGGKWGPCCGQACIGIDYILVERKFSATLIELLQRTVKKFYGENPQSSKSICRIVNKNHFERLKSMLKDPAVADSVKFGGSMDEEKLFIEPTILLDPPLDSELMMSEIFGPLLPVITVDDIQESIEFINSRPKPLAIYAFTKNEAFKQRIIRETSSGSITFNDVMVQFVCDELPFGGVGQSGFGRYHGKYSFDTFSHEKAVMRRGFFPELEPRYPPWNDFKLRFIRLAYRFNYLGLLLLMLLGRR